MESPRRAPDLLIMGRNNQTVSQFLAVALFAGAVLALIAFVLT
jgi:hypothetical protein